MQEQGLTRFDSVEEFKRAFLPAHEACEMASKTVVDCEQKIKGNEGEVRAYIDALTKELSGVENYFAEHNSTLEDSLLNLVSNEKPSKKVQAERKAAQTFDNLIQHAGDLQGISQKALVDQAIVETLHQYSQEIIQSWREVSNTLSQVRKVEGDFYNRYQELADERRAEEKRQREEQLRLEAEAQAAAARRKSIQKKLLWTAGFILALAGFLQNQMA